MSRRSATNLLLWCGVLGPPLFIVVFLVEGATRASYDPVRLPISLLSLGDRGWTQTLNFIVDGVLLVAFAIGLAQSLSTAGRASWWGPILIGILGIGVLCAGVFPTDPGGGYPPSAHPGNSSGITLHDIATLVVFASLAGACIVMGHVFAVHGQRGWAWYSRATGATVVVGFVLIVIAFNGSNDLTRVGGLIQRVAVIAGWTWIALVAIHQIRSGDAA
jgi:hypothetical protein